MRHILYLHNHTVYIWDQGKAESQRDKNVIIKINVIGQHCLSVSEMARNG